MVKLGNLSVDILNLLVKICLQEILLNVHFLHCQAIFQIFLIVFFVLNLFLPWFIFRIVLVCSLIELATSPVRSSSTTSSITYLDNSILLIALIWDDTTGLKVKWTSALSHRCWLSDVIQSLSSVFELTGSNDRLVWIVAAVIVTSLWFTYVDRWTHDILGVVWNSFESIVGEVRVRSMNLES
jgi:hypothetical protein